MFKLSPKGSKVHFYGYIVNAKTDHADQKRIGYRLIIKTTITIRHQQEDIPLYLWFVEKKGRELYEWWVTEHRREPAPVEVFGIKKGQRFGSTRKMDYENAKRIIWIYIRANGRIIPSTEGIPVKYQNMLIY